MNEENSILVKTNIKISYPIFKEQLRITPRRTYLIDVNFYVRDSYKRVVLLRSFFPIEQKSSIIIQNIQKNLTNFHNKSTIATNHYSQLTVENWNLGPSSPLIKIWFFYRFVTFVTTQVTTLMQSFLISF